MKIALREVAKEVAEKVEINKNDVKTVIDTFLSEVFDNLVVGNDVALGIIGTLKLADVKAKPERVGIIKPSTGEKGTLPATPACKKVKFTASKGLKETVKEKTIQ